MATLDSVDSVDLVQDTVAGVDQPLDLEGETTLIILVLPTIDFAHTRID